MIKKILTKFSSLRYVLSSAAAFVVDNALYFLLLHFALSGYAVENPVAASSFAQAAARIFSSFFNFNCNYYFVFRGKQKYGGAMLKYYCLCIPQALLSMLLLDIVLAEMNIGSDLLRTGIKILIEAVLFVISYFIQSKWVFSKKR